MSAPKAKEPLPEEPSPGFIGLGGELLEECWNPKTGKAYFYYQGINLAFPDPVRREISWIGDGRDVNLVPIVDDMVTKGAILLPQEPLTYGDELSLYRSIRSFIYRWVDIDDRNLDILALFTMLTWLYDKARSLPLISIRGGAESGKSRLGETLGQISYRCIKTSGCGSYSALFRSADRWQGTIYVNESDLTRSDEDAQIVKYLNCSYEAGSTFQKTDINTLKVQCFRSFGPRILTSRKSFNDDGLESRCLVIPMRPMKRDDIPFNLDQSFYDEALELRNKLLMFRFKNYGRYGVDASIRFPSIGPRLNQILQPLASLAKLISDEIYASIKELAAGFEDRLVADRAESPDGLIIRAYFRLESRGELPTSTAISEEVRAIGGSDIKPNAVGRRMTALSIPKIASSDGRNRFYRIEEGERPTLIRKYLPRDERLELGFPDASNGSSTSIGVDAPSDESDIFEASRRSGIPDTADRTDGFDSSGKSFGNEVMSMEQTEEEGEVLLIVEQTC